MTYSGAPTWRLFRDIVGVAMFGKGGDARNFSDSTDLYITVDMRFQPDAAGTGWLGVRTTPSITGAGLNGYFVELRRHHDGATDVVVRYESVTEKVIFYEGPFRCGRPAGVDYMTAISFKDQLAFFVNGRFVAAIDNAAALGGTLALGVDEGTVADFDELIIRDTTPHGGQ
jgi:hypothetical protein